MSRSPITPPDFGTGSNPCGLQGGRLLTLCFGDGCRLAVSSRPRPAVRSGLGARLPRSLPSEAVSRHLVCITHVSRSRIPGRKPVSQSKYRGAGIPLQAQVCIFSPTIIFESSQSCSHEARSTNITTRYYPALLDRNLTGQLPRRDEAARSIRSIDSVDFITRTRWIGNGSGSPRLALR